jgi:large subunit ribosomal protein L10
MHRTEKEKVVAELAERLRSTESLIVADYRGLTNAELVALRAKLRGSGARLQVVKNTLTRRAAEEAGTDSLLALLEGPTAIAFVETEGDPVAVAKALSDTAKETKVLELRGGILAGRTIDASDVEELAKLPAPEVVKSQLVGVIVAPLTQLVGLIAAPLRDLVGLIDARIAQLEEQGDASASTAAAAVEEESSEADAAELSEAPAAEVSEAPAAEAATIEEAAPAEADEEPAAEEPPPAGEQPQAAAEPAEETSESTDEASPAAEPADAESEE